MPNAKHNIGLVKGGAVAALFVAQLTLGVANAQSSRWTEEDARKDRECSSVILDMGAASSKPEIADIDAVTAIVERYNVACKHLGSPSGFATLALVHLHQRQFAKAIEFANQCLAVRYRELECHKYKIEALLASRQDEKGKAALAIARNLADQAVAQAEAGLSLNPQYKGELQLALASSKKSKTYFDEIAVRLEELGR